MNEKIVQLTHSELDIKNKKSLKKKVKMEENFQITSGKLKKKTTLYTSPGSLYLNRKLEIVIVVLSKIGIYSINNYT